MAEDEFTHSTDDENQPHVQSTDKQISVNAPEGVWVDVRAGQRTAEGVYADPDGILRDEGDHSIVVWHFKPRKCVKKIAHSGEIVYHPRTKAPWCPDCLPAELIWEKMERKKQRRSFAGKRKRRKEIERRQRVEAGQAEPEYESMVIRENETPELFDAVKKFVDNPLLHPPERFD